MGPTLPTSRSYPPRSRSEQVGSMLGGGWFGTTAAFVFHPPTPYWQGAGRGLAFRGRPGYEGAVVRHSPLPKPRDGREQSGAQPCTEHGQNAQRASTAGASGAQVAPEPRQREILALRHQGHGSATARRQGHASEPGRARPWCGGSSGGASSASRSVTIGPRRNDGEAQQRANQGHEG